MEDREGVLYWLDTMLELLEAVPLELFDSGCWSGRPWHAPGGVFPGFELMYVVEGSGEVTVGKKSFLATAGDMIFSDRALPTRCSSQNLTVLFVAFLPKRRDICEKLSAVCARLGYHCEGSAGLLQDEWDATLSAARLQTDVSARMARHRLCIILLKLTQQVKDSEFGTLTGSLQTRQLEEMLRLLQANLDNPDAIELLSQSMGLTSRHISAIFKQRMGCGIKRYVIAQRVEKSCRLLRYTQLPLSEIALICGFCDSQHFCRVFKTHTGNTPMHYRLNISPRKAALSAL